MVKTSSPGFYTVAPLTNDSRLENGVRLTWGQGNEASSMTCTCGYPARWETSCRHIVAVCEGERVWIYCFLTLVAPWEGLADFIVLRTVKASSSPWWSVHYILATSMCLRNYHSQLLSS